MPVYNAACCLYPRYKYYCKNSWANDKDIWLKAAEAAFQLLWCKYKSPRPPTARSQAHKQGDIDDTIDAIADYHASENDYVDELEQ